VRNVRLKYNRLNKPVVRHLVMLPVCNSQYCDDPYRNGLARKIPRIRRNWVWGRSILQTSPGVDHASHSRQCDQVSEYAIFLASLAGDTAKFTFNCLNLNQIV
jgi:hypothetical protein